VRGILVFAVAGAVACGGESKRIDSNEPGAGGTGASQASSSGADGGTVAGTSGSGASMPGAMGGTSECSELSPGFANCCAADGTGNTRLVPTATGWIDYADYCNDVGVQGRWHVYGDQYDSPETNARCVKVGLHPPSDCAQVIMPAPPPAWGFPNVDGELHTAGIADATLPCPMGLTSIGCPENDFQNMNGAGIALDFSADAGPPDGDGARHAWDPSAVGVIGVSFVIDGAPKQLRVEFPTLLTEADAAAEDPPITAENPTSDDDPTGSPYWGAQAEGDQHFPASPVVAGQNVITWDQVASPRSRAYAFDPHRMLGVRFHVPAGVSVAYDFTVKDFTFLRHL
jgi:hypothetical protein